MGVNWELILFAWAVGIPCGIVGLSAYAAWRHDVEDTCPDCGEPMNVVGHSEVGGDLYTCGCTVPNPDWIPKDSMGLPLEHRRTLNWVTRQTYDQPAPVYEIPTAKHMDWLGHVEGCTFTTDEGWICQPTCTAGVGVSVEVGAALIEDGWRRGQDLLWHNDRFGGSYKTENALRRIGSQHGEVTDGGLERFNHAG